MKHQSFDRRHVVYCVQQVFQQRFVHVGYLETVCIRHDTVGFIGLRQTNANFIGKSVHSLNKVA